MGKPKKRVNPKVTSKVDRNSKELYLKEIIKTVRKLPPPWKPASTGHPPCDIAAVTVLCFYKEAMGHSYDALASDLAASKDWFCDQLNVEKLPSRSAIHRGMQKLSQKYIRRINNKITARFRRKGLVVIIDSSGIRWVSSSQYYDMRIKRKNKRKGNSKLSIAIDAMRMVILEFKISWIYRNDRKAVGFLLKGIDHLKRLLGDAGYIAKIICELAMKKGGYALFSLKSNTRLEKTGNEAWNKFIEVAMKEKLFKYLKGVRSRVEAVFSSIKRRFGASLTAIKTKMRNIQIGLRVVAYNIKQLLYDKFAKKLGLPYWVPY